MLKDLVESLRYIGHFFPVTFIRLFMGLSLFRLAFKHEALNYLEQPIFSSWVKQWFVRSDWSNAWNFVFEEFAVSYWKFFSYLDFTLLLIGGVLLILGFLVRPVCVVLFVYLFWLSQIQNPLHVDLLMAYRVGLVALFWAGAGRCLGLDYYFYKRRRGFLW